MTILLSSVVVRHERRLRLVFSNTLAAGAFDVSHYTIETADDVATPPEVQEAYLVPGSPTVVELALDGPLVRGALYTVLAENVPATDLSDTDPGTSLNFRWGITAAPVNIEPGLRDKNLLLYGIDLIWNGVDYQESSTGDLDRVSGPANVTKALNRGVETNPGDLTWDVTYGAGAREFIDSPSVLAGTLKGSVSSQMVRDPRVKSVKVTHDIQDSSTFLFADATLISGETAERVSIEVPNDT